MQFLQPARLSLAAAALAISGAVHGAAVGITATFDDLPSAPALDSATGLQFANNSLTYQGVTWDPDLYVAGDQYRTDPNTPGPLFGIPHSGHYFVFNHSGFSGFLITTDKVLTGAWFGRNQYYGFSEGGADQITIVALSGAIELQSIVFDLPESHPGEPEPLSFVDTGSFGALSGITGYRIDRRELGTQAGNWVADDFQFQDANAVPAPGSLALLAAGALLALVRKNRRT